MEWNGVAEQDHGSGMRGYGNPRTFRFEVHQLKLVSSLSIHFNVAADDIEEDVMAGSDRECLRGARIEVDFGDRDVIGRDLV
jgi:hypothetical protein